jgi:TrmH family RNA methyltransferase
MSTTDGVRHERIESLSNPLVKELRELRTRKGRLEQRRFMAEGERTLAEAAAGGWRAELLLVTPDAPRSAVAAERIIEVTDEVLAKITGRDNPQPQLGIFSDPDRTARRFTAIDPATASRWLMLEAPRDPGNLGSCIRSADAVAAGGVLLVGDACDAYSVECVRATMGSIFSVPIFHGSIEEACELLARWPGETIATAGDAPGDYASLSYKAPAAIVVGTEAEGLSRTLRNACSATASIPMLGRAESLNMGVAAAITLYAAERAQRLGRGT